MKDAEKHSIENNSDSGLKKETEPVSIDENKVESEQEVPVNDEIISAVQNLKEQVAPKINDYEVETQTPKVEDVKEKIVDKAEEVKSNVENKTEEVKTEIEDVKAEASVGDLSASIWKSLKVQAGELSDKAKDIAGDLSASLQQKSDVVKSKSEEVKANVENKTEELKAKTEDVADKAQDKVEKISDKIQKKSEKVEPNESEENFTEIINDLKNNYESPKKEISRRILRELQSEMEKEQIRENAEKEISENEEEFSAKVASPAPVTVKQSNTNSEAIVGANISKNVENANEQNKAEDKKVEEEKNKNHEKELEESTKFEAPIEISETESTMVRRKSLLGQNQQENEQGFEDNNVRLAWQPLKQEAEKTEEEKLETILEGATVYPTLPSRAPAHWWSILLGLLALPLTWFFINDGISRLNTTNVSKSVISLGAIEITIATVLLVVFLIATQFSSVGTFIMGVLVTALGVPFLFFPAATQNFLEGFKDRAERIGGLVETIVEYLLKTGYQGKFFFFGVLLILIGFISHTARRQGRREQQIRNDLGLVGIDDRIAKKARKAAMKAELAEEKAKAKKRKNK